MLREETRKAMKLVSKKITELYELEKKSWGDLDDIEVKVSEMVREVETITEQQVSWAPNDVKAQDFSNIT